MDPWKNDSLGYKAIGETFTNLIKSMDVEKVISIEAGFGRGKTFFRKAWSEHLRQSGEIVVEIDVQQSDHSGDPVVTLLAALVEELPEKDKAKSQKAIESAKKIGTVGAKALTKLLLRSGAEDVIDFASDKAVDALGDFDALDGVIADIGDGMSKAAGQMIAAQMAAEKVRKEELPEQLNTLRSALVEKSESDRVIVVIDELDRCHPDYAIAVLEAMKLVFNQAGFVFCLMVNADYLEKLAQHRFGVSSNDEKYLDKFVDIRLRLEPRKDILKNAVFTLAEGLPLQIPFGDDDAFSISHAAELASSLAVDYEFSMRKTKRILLKVEVALRCYGDRPLDASLLVFLAFQDEIDGVIPSRYLPRVFVTPEEGYRNIQTMDSIDYDGFGDSRNFDQKMYKLIAEGASELLDLPIERYKTSENKDYKSWYKVFKYLAPHYLPSHRDVLNAVGEVIVYQE